MRKDESRAPGRDKGPAWLKPACDYVPLLVFLAVYFASDILTATAALMAATLLAVIASWAVARAIPWLPLFAAAILGVFGGLTLAFEDDIWLKIRPTVMQVIFAVALYGSLLLGKPLLKLMINRAFAMPDPAWRVMTLRFALFFLVMAVLNEVVWRTQSTDFWVTFDTIGQMGINFIFAMSQLPYMLRQHEAAQAAEKGGDIRPGDEST
ncbi:inner membrane-spanning protein YciB [Algihabitans albus]|uniref:inner membrane-spanning protein YciB n=1 Tax=Algihabitans albus TaxID=2164067 RepID=UPI0013C2CE0E|nr:septation protein IspZ [Algihabitans albus]